MIHLSPDEIEDGDVFECPVFTDNGHKIADPFTVFDSGRIELLQNWAISGLHAESAPMSEEKKNKIIESASKTDSHSDKLFESQDPVGDGLVSPARSRRSDRKEKTREAYRKSLELTGDLLKPLSQGRINDAAPIYGAIEPIFDLAWDSPLLLMYRIADVEPSKGDEYIYVYSLHTSLLSIWLAQEINYSRTESRRIAVSALVHDVGMFQIPQHLRRGVDDLTDEQFETIQRHPKKGAHVLSNVERLRSSVTKVAAEHHEQVDGSGYPHGLTEDHIHDHSKIVNLAMTFVAMTQPRSHRQSHSVTDSIKDIFLKNRTVYDTTVLKAFLRKIGLYPPGSFVRLDTGHLALVIKANSSKPDQPILKVLAGPGGEEYKTPFRIELEDYSYEIDEMISRLETERSALEVA